MKPVFCRKAAFSLVEVVIAIGVISFGVVAILGLLSVSLNTSRVSASDTAIGAMTGSIVNRFRSRPFDQISGGDFYFDTDGVPQTAVQSDSVYKCTVTVVDDADTMTAATDTVPARVNLKKIKLKFTWPAQTTDPPNEQIVNATVARH